MPMAGDNCAVATAPIAPAEPVEAGGATVIAAGYVYEGQRIAVAQIPAGEALTSWGLPFGIALRGIAPGEMVANTSVLDELRHHHPPDRLPAAPNFEDRITPFRLDRRRFRPAPLLPSIERPPRFMGHLRTGERGTGTRNHVVLLGVSSLAAGFARETAARLRHLAGQFEHVDDIVAVAHTEGAGNPNPNNREHLLCCLGHYMVHPNVGAVIAIDHGGEAVNNTHLREHAAAAELPLDAVPHAFVSLRDGWDAATAKTEALVRDLLPRANACARQSRPFAELRLGLQCGGSDAFSGISANPLVAHAAAHVIRCGGAANLAETDELIGAESYVLRSVRDLPTAEGFLDCIARFKSFAERYGHTAEGNPSGGNRLRGLSNIVLKSIGAAAKKHPDCRLEGVLPYGGAIPGPGLFFMDSPGNDLESVAGQVASGCNLILFTTGNGSITNFPFVPTLKIVTTTARYRLLEREMDFNAGALVDGTPMEDLQTELVDQIGSIASGARTKGERAGHFQTQIWRDWPDSAPTAPEPRLAGNEAASRERGRLDGQPHPVEPGPTALPDEPAFEALYSPDDRPPATDAIGLIFPTSLCAGQVAHLIAERLNRRRDRFEGKITRFVALPHTEGCGFAGDDLLHLLMRCYSGYAMHPNVCGALMLEHGCEKTHNAVVREAFAAHGADPDRFGWASIQRDGGIESCAEHIERWFADHARSTAAKRPAPADWSRLALGLLAEPGADGAACDILGQLAREILARSGTVITLDRDERLHAAILSANDARTVPLPPTLAYGQANPRPGLHVMETHYAHWIENISGLGACGVHLILGAPGESLRQGHPMIPTLLLGNPRTESESADLGIDIHPHPDPNRRLKALVQLVNDTLSRRRPPRATKTGNTDFQLTRGRFGISM